MMILRPVETNDLAAIIRMASECGVGMTTLPNDENALSQRIQASLKAFATPATEMSSGYYFFVLEDSVLQKVVGCCAIKSAAGMTYPLYSYKLSTVTTVSTELNFRKDHKLLHLVNDMQGQTEICTLFLSKDYRKSNNGPLLSRSRFVFMAQHTERFSDTVFAEMRGDSDAEGNSPFWDSLGQHFFEMDFASADYLSAVSDKQFIADLMPREPIYTCFLSPEAQAVIGKPHRSTKPAMKILQHQGFYFQDYVDIFDAGPTITAPLQQIKTVQNTQRVTIKGITPLNSETTPYIITNTELQFRACLERIELDEKQSIIISPETAEALQLSIGDEAYISIL